MLIVEWVREYFCLHVAYNSIIETFLLYLNDTGRMYKYAMQEVKATQVSIHTKLVADVAAIEASMLSILAADPDSSAQGNANAVVVHALTDFVNKRAGYVVQEWQKLLPRLIST